MKTGLRVEGSAMVGALAGLRTGFPQVLRIHPPQQAGGHTGGRRHLLS